MDTDTYDWLTRMVDEALDHPLMTPWEHSFLSDQKERLANYATNTLYSEKQWAQVLRIAKKIDFERAPDNASH